MKNNVMLLLSLFLFNITDIFTASTPKPCASSTQIEEEFRPTPAWIDGIRPPAKGFYVAHVAGVHKDLWEQKARYLMLNPDAKDKRLQFTQLQCKENIKTGLYQIRWKENERDKEDWFTIEQKHLDGFVLRFSQIGGIWRVAIESAAKRPLSEGIGFLE